MGDTRADTGVVVPSLRLIALEGTYVRSHLHPGMGASLDELQHGTDVDGDHEHEGNPEPPTARQTSNRGGDTVSETRKKMSPSTTAPSAINSSGTFGAGMTCSALTRNMPATTRKSRTLNVAGPRSHAFLVTLIWWPHIGRAADIDGVPREEADDDVEQATHQGDQSAGQDLLQVERAQRAACAGVLTAVTLRCSRRTITTLRLTVRVRRRITAALTAAVIPTLDGAVLRQTDPTRTVELCPRGWRGQRGWDCGCRLPAHSPGRRQREAGAAALAEAAASAAAAAALAGAAAVARSRREAPADTT